MHFFFFYFSQAEDFLAEEMADKKKFEEAKAAAERELALAEVINFVHILIFC